jgi:hypothetical protein
MDRSDVVVQGPFSSAARVPSAEGATVVTFDQERYLLQGAGAARLALVGQLGRSFEDEHPEVPVLVRSGRYLIVDTGGRHIDGRDPACWNAVPVAAADLTVTTRSTVAARAPIPWVQALVDRVEPPRLAGDIAFLAGFPTRHSASSEFIAARDQLRTRLDALGYTTSVTPVAVGAQQGSNLVADRAGSAANRGLVVVTAHLDSVNIAGGQSAAAPGADDNASGSAGVMEIARVLAAHPAENDLRLILFGGEEQGLHGSTQLVAAMPAAERQRVRAVVNMDMIAVRNTPGTDAVLLEGAAVSSQLIDALAEAAATYTTLSVTTSLNPFASDHVPFINAGMPAVLTIEGNDSANTAIHTAGDVIGRTDATLAAQIVRMNVAALAQTLGRSEPVNPELPKFPIEIPESILEMLRPKISGRYEYNGGASTASRDVEQTRFTPATDGPDGLPSLPLPPLPVIEPPASLPPGAINPGVLAALRRPGITLHVDVDRTFPLDVVSGAVRRPLMFAGSGVTHFIGRVTAKTKADSTTTLVVEDFSFTWPGSTFTVTRLDVEIDAAPFTDPTARATFHSSTPSRQLGPYTLERVSTTFRELEIEIDTEQGAVDGQTYQSHTHPDRPAGLVSEQLTIEKVFGRAGVGLTRSPSGNVIATSTAGSDSLWSVAELHDAMQSHWSRFANTPQWKMWVFMAGRATSPTLGGIMFDGDIDEPGGVDRQGTAIFTQCEFFHGAAGDYPIANPPAAAAASRELFFDVIHEMGHAFNLAHSFQKTAVFDPGNSTWPAPVWMPVVQDPQSLSFMNYPDEASPGSGLGAKWFYDRFAFRFDDNELLFLRHAPERFVQMGNAAWFENHGRVPADALDPRLGLTLRTRTPSLHWGTPLRAELKLTNNTDMPVVVDPVLDPAAEATKIAIIDPAGERRPFLPFTVERQFRQPRTLLPGESIYAPIMLAVGKLGVPFKQAGLHTVQATYRNLDGTAAVAAMYVNVLAPTAEESMAAAVLHTAQATRVLTVGGTRDDEVNAQFDWAVEKLGPDHPASIAIRVAEALPLAQDFKYLAGDESAVQLLPAEPDAAARDLAVVAEQPEQAADALGHITYGRVMQTYTDCAVRSGDRKAAADAQRSVVELFTSRGVVRSAIAVAEERLAELQ